MSEALATSKSFAIIRPSSALVSVVLRRGGVPYFGRFYTYAMLQYLCCVPSKQASTWFAPIEGVISFSVGSGHVSLCTSLATWQLLAENLDGIILS